MRGILLTLQTDTARSGTGTLPAASDTQAPFRKQTRDCLVSWRKLTRETRHPNGFGRGIK